MHEENDYVIAKLHEALNERDAEVSRLHRRLSRKLDRGEWYEVMIVWMFMHQAASLAASVSVGIAIGWWFL